MTGAWTADKNVTTAAIAIAIAMIAPEDAVADYYSVSDEVQMMMWRLGNT